MGNAVQTLQRVQDTPDEAVTRYWTWRFDRTNDMTDSTMLEDFWGKTTAQAVGDLQVANDPLVGTVNGPVDVELVVDAYYPKTVPTVPTGLSGFTIHSGGRNRLFLDYHVEYLKDVRTPN